MKFDKTLSQFYFFGFLIQAAAGSESSAIEQYVPFSKEVNLFTPRLVHTQPAQCDRKRSLREDIVPNMKGVNWRELQVRSQRRADALAEICRFPRYPVGLTTIINLSSGPLRVSTNSVQPDVMATFATCYNDQQSSSEFSLLATNNVAYVKVSFEGTLENKERYVLSSKAHLQFSQFTHNVIVLKEYLPEYEQRAKMSALNIFEPEKRRRAFYASLSYEESERAEIIASLKNRPVIFFHAGGYLPLFN